ncbi:hypothetical protein BJX62DRAFT_166831 [Aspergillus germanicus]
MRRTGHPVCRLVFFSAGRAPGSGGGGQEWATQSGLAQCFGSYSGDAESSPGSSNQPDLLSSELYQSKPAANLVVLLRSLFWFESSLLLLLLFRIRAIPFALCLPCFLESIQKGLVPSSSESLLQHTLLPSAFCLPKNTISVRFRFHPSYLSSLVT